MSDKLHDIHRQLRATQGRLGTSAELPTDFERVLQLAHDLSDGIAAEYLRSATEFSDAPPPSLAKVSRDCLLR